MERDELRRAEALDRYWDELALGRGADGAERPDDDMAELVDHLWEMGAPPNPRRARERVWRELRRHPGWRDPAVNGNFRAQPSIGEPRSLTTLDDRGAYDVPPAIAAQTRPARPRDIAAQMATAALILLTLATGLLLFQIVRPGWLFPPRDPLIETLLDQPIEAGGTPGSWVPISLERWTFAPGSTTLTVSPLDGLQWIAADGGRLVAAVDGQERELAVGEALVVVAGQELTLRNAGASEAAAIRGIVSGAFANESYDPSAISQQVVVDTAAAKAAPVGPSRLVFVRMTLPPGSALPPDVMRERDWFGVIEGRLGLTLSGAKLPAGWKAGVEREMTTDEQLPRLVPGTEVRLRNMGDETLVVLRLTVLAVDQVSEETDPIVAVIAGVAISWRRPRRARQARGEVTDGPG